MRDYLFRLEPAEPCAALSAELIENELRAHGLLPREVVHVERGWLVRMGATSAAPIDKLRFSDGWRVIDEGPVLGQTAWPETSELRAVGELFTYALLLWPAVVALFALDSQGWQLALKIALAIWLGLLHVVACRGAGGRFFGNSLLMLSGCVAAFWWTHPGPWMYIWLFVILVGVYAAVRGALRVPASKGIGNRSGAEHQHAISRDG